MKLMKIEKRCIKQKKKKKAARIRHDWRNASDIHP